MSFITIIFLICAYIFNFDSKDEFVWIMVFCGFVEVIFSGRLLLLLPLMIGNYFGLHVVSYAAVSYALGSIHLTIYEEQWYATAWWTGLGAALVMFVQLGLLWI